MLLVYLSDGFLLNGRTTVAPTNTPMMSNHQHTALINLIIAERDSRMNLEQRVTHLEIALVETQRGVTDMYNENQKYNKTLGTYQTIIDDLKSKHKCHSVEI